MSNKHDEALSAFFDGEWTAADVDDNLNQAGLRQELMQSEQRYAAIGKAIRGEAQSAANQHNALAQRISAALADEATVLAPTVIPTQAKKPKRNGPQWMPYAAAASLAIAGVVGYQFAQQQQVDQAMVAASVPKANTRPFIAASVNGSPQRALPSRLEVLLLNHNEALPGSFVNRAPTQATVVSLPAGH